MAEARESNETLINAPELPMAKPEDVGMSSERLERIRPVMQNYVDSKKVPGVATLIARHGKVVYLDTVGYRDVEAGAPMQADTIFRIASMTKPIVSVALMTLFEEGRFLLSHPIKKWIPEFANPMVARLNLPGQDGSGVPYDLVPAARDITIRHLLTHTAGLASSYRGVLQRDLEKISEYHSKNETVGDFVKRYAKLPLMAHPGEAWEYSRATCVVGHLVELLSGMTLDEYLKERIFKPLGMVDTHFYLPLEKLDRFAAQYTRDENGQIELQDAPTPESRFVKEPHTYFMGSGGLVSTISDYFRFNQMMLNRGQLDGVRILSRKTVEFMTTSHIGDLPVWLYGPTVGFGLGYGVAKDLSRDNTLTALQKGPYPWTPGTYTWGGAFCTFPFSDPTEQMTGLVMTQVRPYDHLDIRQDFVTLANQAIAD
jgi:CubicO group peptidase (beta-lactamase class C family)